MGQMGCCPWKGDHPWRRGRGKGRALSEGRFDNCIFFGPRRIFCPRGSNATISWLGVLGGRGVGGIGGSGIGEDGVEVDQVAELFPAEVTRVVATELHCEVGGGGEDGVRGR